MIRQWLRTFFCVAVSIPVTRCCPDESPCRFDSNPGSVPSTTSALVAERVSIEFGATTITMGGTEAQSGFYYQNVLGALRALDLIELGNPLFSVSFDNPAKAQYIDDIVAEGTGFVEFTQVKWAQDEDASFTLANLTAVDESSGKSLLQKIAEGFRQIQ